MKKIIPPVFHGGNLESASEQYGFDPAEMVDFSANINWFGAPPQMSVAIERGLSLMKHYPDPASRNLIQAIASAVNLPADSLLVGNGSIELMYAFMRAVGKKRALVIEPTFSEYARAVQMVGGSIITYPLYGKNDWQINLKQLAKDLVDVDLVFICNPNNPTGQLIPRDDVVDFIFEAEKRGVVVALDEAFIDFVEDFSERTYSVLDLVTTCKNLVVFRSFTKFFAIPGLRLGFCAAHPGLIQEIAAQQEPWTVNCIAQSVGELIVSEEVRSYRAQARAELQRVRSEFSLTIQKKLALMNWGAVNFLLLDLGAQGRSAEITQILGRRGILVRDCQPFGERFSRYIRVAVRSPRENLRLLQELAVILERD